MAQHQAMTKLCMAPWRELELGIDGTIRPCSGPVQGDFGNINSALSGRESFRDLLNSKAHKQLRNQLLSGELQSECDTCRVVPDQKIPTEGLHRLITSYLISRGKCIYENTDLASEFHIESCNTGITDKCMLSCIYCFIHSNDKAGEGTKLYKEVNHDSFLKQVSLLVDNGLKRLNICGSGEPTIYSSWRDLFTTLFDSYPGLYITLVSNFGRKFTDIDLEILMRFKEIIISCDTLDPELFSWLRPGGKINILLDNIRRLKAKMDTTLPAQPTLIINATESNVMLDKVTDLAKYAVDNDIGLQFSNLLVVQGSYAEKNKSITKITEIPDNQVPAAWEIISDLADRVAAQNPRFHLALGPMYEIMRRRAESISFHRFVPPAEELFYRCFASFHPKNPKAVLRKVFRSFDDFSRGILIEAGSTVTFELPYPAARLKYRSIWVKDNHPGMCAGAVEESSICSRLTIATRSTGRFYTHVLVEVLGYEMEKGAGENHETLLFAEPRGGLDECSRPEGREAYSEPVCNVPANEPAEMKRPCPETDSFRADDFLNAYGQQQFRKGKNYHAHVCFELAIEHNPNHAAAHSNLGVLLWQEGNPKEALEAFHRALDLDSGNPDILHNCSKALAVAGELQTAADLLKFYLQRCPQDATAWDDFVALIGELAVPKGEHSAGEHRLSETELRLTSFNPNSAVSPMSLAGLDLRAPDAPAQFAEVSAPEP